MLSKQESDVCTIAIAPTVFTIAVLLAPWSAAAGSMQYEGYRVNFTSFNTLLGGQDARRVIEYSLAQWAWQAGYGLTPYIEGDSNQTLCQRFTTGNLVHAGTTCETPDCGYAGQFVWGCGIYRTNWNIRINPTPANGPWQWSLDPLSTTAASRLNLQAVLTHEYGHRTGIGTQHSPDQFSIMFGTTQDSVDLNLSGWDIRNSVSTDVTPKLYWSTSNYISPGSTTWSGAADTGTYGGIGLLSAASQCDSLLKTLPNAAAYAGLPNNPWAMQRSSIPTLGSWYLTNPSLPASTLSTIVRDQAYGRQFAFWRSDIENSNGSVPVRYAVSYDGGANWQHLGLVAGGGISTRVPVSAAYDYWSRRVVVAYTSSHGSANSVGRQEIGITSVSGLDPTSWTPTESTGLLAVGPPAFGCDSSGAYNYYQCTVLYTGTDSNRHIMSANISISGNGRLYYINPVTTPVDTGGWTNDPISLVDRGNYYAGFVAMHRGTTAAYYETEKADAMASWTNWSQAPALGTGHLGPVLRFNETGPWGYVAFIGR